MYKSVFSVGFIALIIPFNVAAKDLGFITAAPRLVPRDDFPPWANSPSCTLWKSLLTSCGSKIGPISSSEASSISKSQQAALVACLCFTTSSSIITSYDDALGTCLAYLKTASPSAYSSYISSLGPRTTYTRPCEEGSSLLSAQSVGSDPRLTACVYLSSIIDACASATPSFTSLPLSSQASCACYLSEGSKWAPQVYDGYLQSCLNYQQTFDPMYYSSTLHGDLITRSPCALVGNIRNVASATGSEASASIPVQTSSSRSAVLTTSQPTATAAANQAPDRTFPLDWIVLVFVMVAPLVGLLCV